jgi:hypothetical protein|tara:strand:- start:242 stop:421 length:180 start_codon:yes stop_codon:yes gene_type:complete
MSIIKQWFPIPLIVFGGIMADLSRHGLGEDIMTVQILSWTSIVVGVIGLARIVWDRVKK